MKGICFLPILLLIAMSSLHCAEPTARSLEKCPFGHKTLKDVPILYGLIVPKGPKEEKQMENEIAEHKYTLGGCCTTPDSPNMKLSVQPADSLF